MVDEGKTRLHSIESRSALECSSPAARSRSCAYSSKNPGPAEGGVPARCVAGSDKSSGRVIQAYQSEPRSSHWPAGTVGQPMSAWKPAMAVPKRKVEEKDRSSPRAQAAQRSRAEKRFMRLCLPVIVVCAASVGCRERLKPESAGAVQFALPKWPERGRINDPAVGYVEKAEKESRVLIAWDIDPR